MQCIIPVVEGLLPEKYEEHVLDLLFTLATWHAYAKLRLHTDNTLSSFERVTKALGAMLRYFGGKFSDSFEARELPKEAAARARRAAKNKNTSTKGKGNGKGKENEKGKGKQAGSSKKRVRFNLSTYKLHALGDYVETIRRRGTTDSYSTQMVST